MPRRTYARYKKPCCRGKKHTRQYKTKRHINDGRKRKS